MTAILNSPCSRLIFSSVNRRMPVFPVICKPAYIQINNWSFGILDNIFYSSHFGRVLGEVSFAQDGFSFLVTLSS